MNRYYKGKKPYRGALGGFRCKTPQLLPTPVTPKASTAVPHHQMISTSFYDNSFNGGTHVSNRGRNIGNTFSAKRVPAGSASRGWPQGNSAFADENNFDETVWEEMDFDFDDPPLMTPNQGYYEENRYGMAARKTPLHANKCNVMASRGGNFYHQFSTPGKRTPLSEVGSSQNYYGPPATGYGPPATGYGPPAVERGYDTYGSNDISYSPATFRSKDSSQNVMDYQMQQPQTLKAVEKIVEEPAEALTQQLDNPQSKIDEGSFPRVFTVSVAKLKTWAKHDISGEVIFEVFGILDSVKTGGPPGVKLFILKGQQGKCKLNCIFYEIDRKLEIGSIGHWQRCVGLLKKTEFQCLSLRPVTQEELQNFDSTLSANSKALAGLLRSVSR